MIDIIMPCYNAEKYIEESVQSVLRQTEARFVLICIDDGSKDDTYRILQRMAQGDTRIRVLKNEHNYGIAATRNRGIREGSAEYIAFFDDDDIMPQDRLRIGREFLDNHPDTGVVAGNYLIFDAAGNRKIVHEQRFYSAAEVRAILPFDNIVPNGTTLIRRETIEKNNIEFHEEYGIEDYRFYSEISFVADMVVLPEILLEHRVMGTQYSAVCSNSSERFGKRQEAFDKVHSMLMHNIADNCGNADMDIYTKFVRENVKSVRVNEVLRLWKTVFVMKKTVKKKGRADYRMFRKYADALWKSIAKTFLIEFIRAAGC